MKTWKDKLIEAFAYLCIFLGLTIVVGIFGALFTSFIVWEPLILDMEYLLFLLRVATVWGVVMWIWFLIDSKEGE
jgi:hypothetical protein